MKYFPYLRGKQYELIMLRDLVLAKKAFANKVIPIVEPVKRNVSGLCRTIDVLKKNDASFVIVVNPKCGELVKDQDVLFEKIVDTEIGDYNNFFVGYIIDSMSTLLEIESFLEKMDRKKNKICFIHRESKFDYELAEMIGKSGKTGFNVFDEDQTSTVYRKLFSSHGKVLMKDGFKASKRNADYNSSEHFSDLHLRALEQQLAGYSDFLIVGDDYSEIGGPAYTVAIHITHFDKFKDMKILHFISDTNTSPVNPAGKFLEALTKLIKYVGDLDTVNTTTEGMKGFKQLYEKKHFPGLGFVKKLSMMHHVENQIEFLTMDHS